MERIDNDEEPIETHLDCPDCGHNGCLTLWQNGGSYCHSCQKKRGGDSGNPTVEIKRRSKGRMSKTKTKIPLVTNGEVPTTGLKSRGLSAESMKKFSVTTGEASLLDAETNRKIDTFEAVVMPYRSIKSNDVVAQKLRKRSKEMCMAKGDNPKEPLQLFGQHLWGKGGKKLIITEGEYDAMAVSQAQDHRWPVVSIGGGAGNALKHVVQNLDYLSLYEEIILMFDMDEQGQEAAKEVAQELACHMTVKIAHLPLKDANDMILAKRDPELISAIFNAREWKPEGIVTMGDLRDDWSNYEAAEAWPYPWDGVTAVTMGLRAGELVTLTAGTGVGKSAVATEMAYDLAYKQKRKIGLVYREQSWSRTIDGLVGLHLGKRIHIQRALRGLPEHIQKIVKSKKQIEDFDQEEAQKAFDEIVNGGKISIDKQWGSEDFDGLLAKIRFMAVAQKCEVIILDHISIIISGLDITDERKALDIAMTRLRDLCEATGVSIIVVSHLKRPDGNKGFEEGLEITLSHLRGSQAISQLSDIVIALQRNKRDPVRRSWTEIVILKNRFTGEDGCTACWLRYDEPTGRLIESEPDFESNDFDDNGFPAHSVEEDEETEDF